jgi:hypothetical protein
MGAVKWVALALLLSCAPIVYSIPPDSPQGRDMAQADAGAER